MKLGRSLVLPAEVALTTVTLAAVLGMQPPVRRDELARPVGGQRHRRARRRHRVPAPWPVALDDRPRHGRSARPSSPPGPATGPRPPSGIPTGDTWTAMHTRPDAGVDALPGRHGPRSRSRPASCWPARSRSGASPTWPTGPPSACGCRSRPRSPPARCSCSPRCSARCEAAGGRSASTPPRCSCSCWCTAWPARTAPATGWPSAAGRATVRSSPRGSPSGPWPC